VARGQEAQEKGHIDELMEAARPQGQADVGSPLDLKLPGTEGLSPAVIQNLPGFFVAIGADGKTLLMNDVMLRALGYTAEEVVGRDYLTSFIPEEDREPLSRIFDRLSRSEETTWSRNRILAKDGRTLDVEWRGRAVFTSDGTFDGLFGVGLDISDRLRAESALRESEARYRSIFESTIDAILIFDLDGTIVEANPSAYQMYGYADGELIGLPAGRLIHVDYYHGFADFRHTIEKGQLFVTRSVNLRKDGSPFDVEVHAAQFTFRDQPHLLTVVRDIENRVKAERALEAARRKVERLHEVARALESCEVEQNVYQITVKASEEILDFAFCSLDMVVGDELVVVGTSSELPTGASRGTPLSEGGLAAKCHSTRRSIVFGSLVDVPDARPTGPAFKSGISAPIGEFGVFQVASPEENAFSDEDVRLLELLLGHAAEAIKRIRLQTELKEQAIHDPLTGVYNRRYFNQVIAQEKSRAARYEHAITFLMVDVNRFKEINDRFGHQTGDKVLQAVAALLAGEVRETDLVVRYGGDEFLIVLPETNGDTGALRKRIESAINLRNGTDELLPFPVTLSIGSTHWEPDSDRPVEAALAEADARMYERKRQGGRA
jgi:diguanylate cyclase (GGDEF)-like protein/PAS domain S-box-containing protein